MSSEGQVSARESSHPYQRLQVTLANLIAETPPGAKLPAEPELARQLGVSRATLREAMRAFEGQGIIRRRQGVGTFVVGHTHVIDSGLEVLESIETMAQKYGLEVEFSQLEVADILADATQAEQLQVPPGTGLVLISRVILAEGRPVAYLVDVLPVDVLPSREMAQGFNGSVLDLLLQRNDIHLARSMADISAVAATGEVARALEIQRGDVLLKFSAKLYTLEEKIIDYSLSYFLPGYFRFHVVRRVGELHF